jgi:hypothetical protein
MAIKDNTCGEYSVLRYVYVTTWVNELTRPYTGLPVLFVFQSQDNIGRTIEKVTRSAYQGPQTLSSM